MRILVGWDDPAQAELLSVYLGVDGNEPVITTEPADLTRLARSGEWGAVVLSLNLPDIDGGYRIFEHLRAVLPECPIIGACRPEDTFRIVKFMANGMRVYLPRDPNGDYLFLLHSTVTSVVAAIEAEREQRVAERLREEIDSVRKLQQSIIPHDLYNPPGYQLCARYEPSQIHVMGGRPVVLAGGDYYDVFSLDDHSVVLLVGDASGHGMKACMSIMTMHTLVRMIRGQQYHDTAAFVAEINRRLCEQRVIQDEGGFITLLYGVLRADRHEFQWTSAGHPQPLLQARPSGTIEAIGDDSHAGLPLGILPDVEYKTFTARIPPRSRVLLYTDGLLEAFPEAHDRHDEYGLPGVTRTLQRTERVSLAETLEALFHDSHAFTGGSGRHDDTSVVLLEREGNR